MPQFGAEYFKLSPEMLCVINLRGEFHDLNPSWEKTLGWPIHELRFTSFFTLIHPDDLNIFVEEFAKLTKFDGHVTSAFECRFRHKETGYRWLQWSASPIKEENQIYCVVRDITIAKRESLVLMETEEVSRVGSWEIDLATNELYWSKMTHQIHETDYETYCPMLEDGLNFFSEDTQKKMEKFIERLLKFGESYDQEFPFITAKGRKSWVRCVARAAMRDGVVLRVFGTIEDVSQRLREKSRYETIIESGNYGTWDWDLETNTVVFNDRFCSMIGLDVSTVKHELATWDYYTHPVDKIQTYIDIQDHLDGKTPYYRNVHRMKHVDGHWVWILDQGRVVEYREGRPVRFSGTHTDITYLKELEEERVRLNDRFKLILEATKFGVWDWEISTNKLVWDDQMFDIFGIKRDEFSDNYRDWINSIIPEDLEKATGALQASVENESIDFDTDFRIRHIDGGIRYIGAKGYVQRDNGGKPIRVTGINWDITNKVEQDKLFATIINNIPIMMIFFKRAGQIEWVNPQCTENLGWTLDDLETLTDLSTKCFATSQEQEIAYRFLSESRVGWHEFDIVKKNGGVAHTVWTNVKLGNGNIISIGQDIGEKKRQDEMIKDQQARMISSAKLSSLGEMASGIAHEINNPLAIIKGKAYHILKKLDSGEVNIEFLSKEISKIEQNSLRIVKIIKGLRTFSRHGEGDPFQVVTFKSLLDDVLELCYERFKYQGVLLKTSGDLDAELLCQETQLAQVLLNLINNAYDAVSTFTEPWVEVKVQKNEETVRISVTDSGHGISAEIAEKIMQPFFTTKEVGVGTGLGLSISKGIVEMHNGKFYLDQNCPNTSFVINLPIKK
jgi:PAS domain S-box-containing protein